MSLFGRKIVLLDLDGTLVKSEAGVLGSVRYIFQELDLPLPSQEALKKFIGPSIPHSLRLNGVGEDLIDKGVAIYRKYHNDIPAFDDPNNPGHKVPGRLCCSVYPGIYDQLQLLHDAGYYLAIASCKPEKEATVVCDHFGFSPYLDSIFGASNEDSSRIDKDQVIQYGFDQLGFNPQQGDRAVMVGDRWTDAEGALACGIDCIGCAWGYAEPSELQSHGCIQVIDEVSDLTPAVSHYFEQQNNK